MALTYVKPYVSQAWNYGEQSLVSHADRARTEFHVRVNRGNHQRGQTIQFAIHLTGGRNPAGVARPVLATRHNRNRLPILNWLARHGFGAVVVVFMAAAISRMQLSIHAVAAKYIRSIVAAAEDVINRAFIFQPAFSRHLSLKFGTSTRVQNAKFDPFDRPLRILPSSAKPLASLSSSPGLSKARQPASSSSPLLPS